MCLILVKINCSFLLHKRDLDILMRNSDILHIRLKNKEYSILYYNKKKIPHAIVGFERFRFHNVAKL